MSPDTIDPGRRAADTVHDALFEAIASGAIALGERLPGELELSESHGVSRAVVREALLRLRTGGLVTSRRGAGTFVSHRPEPRIAEFASPGDVAEALLCQELRESIEGDAAAFAARRHTEEQLARIRAAHDAFADEARQGRMPVAEDLAFHAAIGAATGNDFYVRALDGIHESMAGFMRLALSLSHSAPTRDRIRQVLDEHAAILDAIASGDGARAGVAMRYHLGQARRRMVARG